jgi:hypothetical protein
MRVADVLFAPLFDKCLECLNCIGEASLYFEAGVSELWTCSLEGKLRFDVAPGQQVDASRLCPGFPQEIA